MPALKNPKHEKFAQACALNVPASVAYREHVSGGKCSDSTAEVTGSTLSNDSKVSLRIAELRARVAKKADDAFDMSKDNWLAELRDIATKAKQVADFSAATGALREIGKGAAFYAPEEVKHSGTVGLEVLQEAVAKVFGR